MVRMGGRQNGISPSPRAPHVVSGSGSSRWSSWPTRSSQRSARSIRSSANDSSELTKQASTGSISAAARFESLDCNASRKLPKSRVNRSMHCRAWGGASSRPVPSRSSTISSAKWPPIPNTRTPSGTSAVSPTEKLRFHTELEPSSSGLDLAETSRTSRDGRRVRRTRTFGSVQLGEKRGNSLFVRGEEFTGHESDPAE